MASATLPAQVAPAPARRGAIRTLRRLLAHTFLLLNAATFLAAAILWARSFYVSDHLSYSRQERKPGPTADRIVWSSFDVFAMTKNDPGGLNLEVRFHDWSLPPGSNYDERRKAHPPTQILYLKDPPDVPSKKSSGSLIRDLGFPIPTLNHQPPTSN